MSDASRVKICPILNLQGCKSIATGIVIILFAVYNYKNIVIFFGSSKYNRTAYRPNGK